MVETLKAGRWPVVELLAADDLAEDDLDLLHQLAMTQDLTGEFVPSSRLTQLCGNADHQGMLARMAEFPCGDAQTLNQFVTERLIGSRSTLAGAVPLFVICDGLQDAHNFGAVLRCCDGVVADAVVIASRNQAAVTPHVARSSAGAVNHLNLFRVDDLVTTAAGLKSQGIALVAASEKSQQSIWAANLCLPAAIVIGSESAGISPDLLALCDLQLGIPMLGQVGSLNAAVAAGILLYETRRQQSAGL